jgi:hypothetical protein
LEITLNVSTDHEFRGSIRSSTENYVGSNPAPGAKP